MSTNPPSRRHRAHDEVSAEPRYANDLQNVRRRGATACTEDEDGRADSEAIVRVRDGDVAAFGAVVERHQARLHRILYRLVGRREDAAEITQQAFLAAYAALARYDGRYPFLPWLVRIGVNLGKDHLKAGYRREIQYDPGHFRKLESLEPNTPESALEHSQQRTRVAAALATLSVGDREILVLKDVEELSFEEIRAILGRPVTALKIRAVRARRRLREALERITSSGEQGQS